MNAKEFDNGRRYLSLDYKHGNWCWVTLMKAEWADVSGAAQPFLNSVRGFA